MSGIGDSLEAMADINHEVLPICEHCGDQTWFIELSIMQKVFLDFWSNEICLSESHLEYQDHGNIPRWFCSSCFRVADLKTQDILNEIYEREMDGR